MHEKYKNSYKVSKKELLSLSVYNVGYQKCDSLHQWGPGIRDHFLIHYIISGRGFYETNGKKYSLESGDTFLVYPNQIVTYYADQNDPWEYAWVGFNGSDALAIINATDFSKETPIIKQTAYGEEIRHQFLHIYESRGNEFDHAVEMTGRLYTALALFMKGATIPVRQTSYSSYVQKGIEYISANYSYPITVEDIASYVGLSRSHLFRSFEKVIAKSPKEYLTEFRIKQACNLLEHSDLSITAIANSVGFENNLYFSKAFHKAMGISPKVYKESKTKESPF
ncbi:MAG: AraC family transcriptional regulator [bacterium]|nr:AraC family transcriptional regulator [bacterium]